MEQNTENTAEIVKSSLKPSHELAASLVTSFDFKNYSLNQVTSTNKHRLELTIRSEFTPAEYSRLEQIGRYYGYRVHLSVENDKWVIKFHYTGYGDYKSNFVKPTFE